MNKNIDDRIKSGADELLFLIGEETLSQETDELLITRNREEHYKSISESEPAFTMEELTRSIELSQGNIDRDVTHIEFSDSLYRLSQTDDFKLFIDYFMNGEKERLSDMLVSANAFDANTKDELRAKMDGIRHFKLFLIASTSNADEARNSLIGEQMNIDVLSEVIEDLNLKGK